jgi:hypothetical protein
MRGCVAAIAHVGLWHIAAQSKSAAMSAAGESGIRIVIATRAGASAHRRAGRGDSALSLCWAVSGRRTWRCPHSAEGDMRALNEGAGLTQSGAVNRAMEAWYHPLLLE